MEITRTIIDFVNTKYYELILFIRKSFKILTDTQAKLQNKSFYISMCASATSFPAQNSVLLANLYKLIDKFLKESWKFL